MRYSLVVMGLLLGGFCGTVFACGGGCGNCAYWNGEECVGYGGCFYGCDVCSHCGLGCDCEYSCVGWCSECTVTGCKSMCDSAKCEKCTEDPAHYRCLKTSNCSSANCESCVNGSCKSNCDPDKCETCDGQGHCKVCGGDPNKVCCNGQCVDKCQTTENPSPCNTSHNEDYKCPGCALGEYGCDTFYTRSYTGMPVRGCSGGCPDDCLSGTVECYDQYKCASTDPLPDHVCMYYPALNQLYCVEYIEHIFCAPCQQDPEDPGEMVFVGDEHCW